MKQKIFFLLAMLFCITLQTMAQTDDDKPENKEVDMDAPTFEPMVKVGKVLLDHDSIQYAQGKLCIKLVYRECNSSSYHLIQAFLGPIRAGFYQAFAALFGASLNKKYDPNGVDRLTERVVRQVESGQI